MMAITILPKLKVTPQKYYCLNNLMNALSYKCRFHYASLSLTSAIHELPRRAVKPVYDSSQVLGCLAQLGAELDSVDGKMILPAGLATMYELECRSTASYLPCS